MMKYQSRPAFRHQAPPLLTRPLVLVVDDEAAVRESICELLQSVGIDAIGFASTREFLDAEMPDRPGCLILDVRMPGASGIELQSQLTSSGNTKPVIFLTGHGDIEMSVRAMRAGALDFLTKPFRSQALLDAVNAGIEKDVSLRTEAQVMKGHADRVAMLTPREREVFAGVARGRLNKQIASDLGISEVTVKFHRGSIKKKMQAASVSELVRAWDSLPAALREEWQPAEGAAWRSSRAGQGAVGARRSMP
jgi:FixJ family two-component response regulator